MEFLSSAYFLYDFNISCVLYVIISVNQSFDIFNEFYLGNYKLHCSLNIKPYLHTLLPSVNSSKVSLQNNYKLH